jgi:hypothetical protein
MQKWLSFVGVFLHCAASLGFTAETGKYTSPRFASYAKPPKTIEDIMPFARAAATELQPFRKEGKAFGAVQCSIVQTFTVSSPP